MSSIRNLMTAISIIGPLVLFKQCECVEQSGAVQGQEEEVDPEEQGGTVRKEREPVEFEKLGTNVLANGVLPFLDPVSADAMNLARVSRPLRRDVLPSIQDALVLGRYQDAIEALGFKDNIPGFKSAYPLPFTAFPPSRHRRDPLTHPNAMVELHLELRGKLEGMWFLSCYMTGGGFRTCYLVNKKDRLNWRNFVVTLDRDEIKRIVRVLSDGGEVPFMGFQMKLRA